MFETGRQGDEETRERKTRRQGDPETGREEMGRQGDEETRRDEDRYNGLPSGIYFIKVEAGNLSAIKKVIKVK